MASVPTFIASRATLQARLHLTGLPAGKDSQELLDEAIRAARSRFYRALGVDRMAELLGFPSVDPADSEEEVFRAVAEQCEARMARLELMRTIPAAFLPAAGDAEERWNQEGLTRDLRTLEEMRQELELQIEQDLLFLAGDGLGEEAVGAAYDIGPACTPPRPGESVGLKLGALPIRQTRTYQW